MRKDEIVVVPSGYGRDDGKHFKITEWDAFQAEWWAWRFALTVKGTTAQIPDAVAKLGMVGITIRLLNGVLGSDIDPAKLKPLLDEMMTCVRMIRDPAHPDVLTAIGQGQDDIEEPRTIGFLRSEVLRVHTGFSVIEGLQTLLSQIRESNSPSIPTSQE